MGQPDINILIIFNNFVFNKRRHVGRALICDRKHDCAEQPVQRAPVAIVNFNLKT